MRAGELVSVIGPNGAGKTTLIHAIMGLNRLSGGTIRWEGEVISTLPPSRLCERGADRNDRRSANSTQLQRAAARQIRLPFFGLLLSQGITRIRFTLESLLLRIGKSPTKADALTLFCVPSSSYACRSVGHQPLAKTAARAKQRPSFF